MGCGTIFSTVLTAAITSTQNDSHSLVQSPLELENMLTNQALSEVKKSELAVPKVNKPVH